MELNRSFKKAVEESRDVGLRLIGGCTIWAAVLLLLGWPDFATRADAGVTARDALRWAGNFLLLFVLSGVLAGWLHFRHLMRARPQPKESEVPTAS